MSVKGSRVDGLTTKTMKMRLLPDMVVVLMNGSSRIPHAVLSQVVQDAGGRFLGRTL